MSETIRVLHIINQLSVLAGAEVSLRETILGSSDSDLEHGVVVLSPGETGLESLLASGVPVFSPSEVGSRRRQLLHVLGSMREFEPTLVHTSLFEADLIGRLAAARLHLPVLTSLVNTPYGPQAMQAVSAPAWKLAGVKRIDGLLARHATSAFHAISQEAARHAVEHLGIDPRTIRVVPRGRSAASLGVRSRERRSAVRAGMGWGDVPVIINVARQEPQKGHEFLVRALGDVLEHFPQARLVLVGRRGRSTDALWTQARHLGIEAAIQDLGVRSDVYDLLAAADAFAFSSLYEGLGGAVVEAAGVGVPVATFAVPAVQEVLGDEHPWLVPIGDARGLATALVEILTGGPNVARVAAQQRERFLRTYELQASVEGMVRLYRDLAQLVTPQASWGSIRAPRGFVGA